MAKKTAKTSSGRSSASKGVKKSSRRKSASTARTNMARKKTSTRSKSSSSKAKSKSSSQITAMRKKAKTRVANMGKRVQAASERMLKKTGMTQAKARRLVNQVKERAGSMSEAAGTILENTTKAAAMAAGVVVGTVQSVMPDDNAKQSQSGSTGSNNFKDDTRTGG